MIQDKPLTYLLGQTKYLVKLKLTEKFSEIRVEFSMENFISLNFISKRENLTQQDLANLFMCDKSAILRNINTFIDHHYIIRVSYKRRKNLILTENANEFLKFALDLSLDVSAEELNHFENMIYKIQFNSDHKLSPSN